MSRPWQELDLAAKLYGEQGREGKRWAGASTTTMTVALLDWEAKIVSGPSFWEKGTEWIKIERVEQM